MGREGACKKTSKAQPCGNVDKVKKKERKEIHPPGSESFRYRRGSVGWCITLLAVVVVVVGRAKLIGLPLLLLWVSI